MRLESERLEPSGLQAQPVSRGLSAALQAPRVRRDPRVRQEALSVPQVLWVQPVQPGLQDHKASPGPRPLGPESNRKFSLTTARLPFPPASLRYLSKGTVEAVAAALGLREVLAL